MSKYIQDLIPPGQGVRTGKKLTKCLGLVVHWIGVNQPRAEVIRRNFERDTCGAHYISDWNDGHIIQCVPEEEICYHVGASSGFSYTQTKKDLCGAKNPNWYFVGIECCISPQDKPPADYAAPGKHMDLGKPSEAQYRGLVAFAADFLTRHGLTPEKGLYLHNDITNKVCHVWFAKDRTRWERFKADVERKMKGEPNMEELKQVVSAELAARDEIQAQAAQKVSPWAKESWDKAVTAGVFDGTRPGGTLTREQAAVVLDRLGLC